MEISSDCKLQFASDNYAPMCPEVARQVELANRGCASSYGADPWSEKVAGAMNHFFERECWTYFVFNGTAANALAISTICKPYNAILAHPLAHIETDKSGAIGFYTGGAVIRRTGSIEALLTPDDVLEMCDRGHDVHSSKNSALLLSQATEAGLVYTKAEIEALCKIAKEKNLKVHMDGARFCNALVSLGVSPKEITWKAGVDILSFGGTKNGSMLADAIVFFDKDLAKEFEWRRKQAGQLYSKARYMAASWLGLLENEVGLKNAKVANDQAAYFAEGLRCIKGVSLKFPVQANELFVVIPRRVAESLQSEG